MTEFGKQGQVNLARFSELQETYNATKIDRERDIRDDLIDAMSAGMCDMGHIVEALWGKIQKG